MRKIAHIILLLLGIFIINLNGALLVTEESSPKDWLLLYKSPFNKGERAILLLNMSGDEDEIVPIPGDMTYHAILSPNNRQVAWVASRTANGQTGIYVAHLFGFDIRQIANWASGSTQYDDQYPVWSEDGKWIYFMRWGVYRVPAKGGKPERVVQPTNPNSRVTQFRLSADNSQIAFIQANPSAPNGIFIQQPDGSLMMPSLDGYQPLTILHWSANGTSLIFSAFRSGTNDFRIYRFWLPTQNLELITEGYSDESSRQSWSPDDQWVISIAGSLNNRYLIRKGATNGSTEVISPTFDEIWEVVWSEDSQWVAFIASGNNGGLYVMRPNGKQLKLISKSAMIDFWFSSNYPPAQSKKISIISGIILALVGLKLCLAKRAD